MNTIIESNVRIIASPTNWIEGEAVRQLHAIARLPGVRLAVGLPDLHPGKGVPVGAAFITEGVVYPHLIGGDIGCGMALFRTGLARRKARPDRWMHVRFDLEHPWEGDSRERLASRGLCSTQFVEAFGSLGGGNHFAELQAVEKIVDQDAFDQAGLVREELVALIHSGSRGFGQSVFETIVEARGVAGLAADSDAATEYLILHDHAAEWAKASRELIAERFLSAIGGVAARVLDSCHNSVRCREDVDGGFSPVWVHRKGAAPSDKGLVAIPGSRGTLSYLVKPTGNQQGNGWSVAHGAGRKWMRSESRLRVRQRYHHRELVQTSLGGRVICEERDLLYEEAPMAYKDIESVIGDLVAAGLVTVVATFRPLLTYKSRKARR